MPSATVVYIIIAGACISALVTDIGILSQAKPIQCFFDSRQRQKKVPGIDDLCLAFHERRVNFRRFCNRLDPLGIASTRSAGKLSQDITDGDPKTRIDVSYFPFILKSHY